MRVADVPFVPSALLALAAVTPTAAAGSVPSQMWMGVERVKIACHFDETVQPAALRESFCRQVVAEAARLTKYPVERATPADLQRSVDNLKMQDKQLLLHVDVDFVGSGNRPQSASMAVRAERLGLRSWQGPRAGPVEVSLKWDGDTVELARPVSPLAFLLSNMRRAGVPHPPRSDRL